MGISFLPFHNPLPPRSLLVTTMMRFIDGNYHVQEHGLPLVGYHTRHRGYCATQTKLSRQASVQRSCGKLRVARKDVDYGRTQGHYLDLLEIYLITVCKPHSKEVRTCSRRRR